MMHKKYYNTPPTTHLFFTINRLLLILTGLFSITSAQALDVFTDFESASIGAINKLSETELVLSLANDNGNTELPDTWRSWWYIGLKTVPTDSVIHLTLQNRGWRNYYLPVYSYDNTHWHRLLEDEVTQSPQCDDEAAPLAACKLFIKKQFTQSPVYLARYYPYTLSHSLAYLDSISDSPLVHREILGVKQPTGCEVELVTISDFSVSDQNKKHIWLHARTHPAETGSSFVLEGLINYLLNGTSSSRQILQDFVFYIVPMHTPEGVVAGNYRTTADSINLEPVWFFDQYNPAYLTADAPEENHILNTKMREQVVNSQEPPIDLALNLHSSNSAPDVPAFFFPHFGSDPEKYTPAQRVMWNNELKFITLVGQNYHGRIEAPPEDGGMGFLNSYFPETWWWYNRGEHAMAMTLETTYGKAGYDDWVTEDNQRELGVALVKSIVCYFVDDSVCIQHMSRTTPFAGPRHPEVYYSDTDEH